MLPGWLREAPGDVIEVVKETSRDEEGITYGVSVILHPRGAHPVKRLVWESRLLFSGNLRLGRSTFRVAADLQESVAEEVARLAWGKR